MGQVFGVRGVALSCKPNRMAALAGPCTAQQRLVSLTWSLDFAALVVRAAGGDPHVPGPATALWSFGFRCLWPTRQFGHPPRLAETVGSRLGPLPP